MKLEEVMALIGDKKCVLKTLTNHNLYCNPPESQPSGTGDLFQFTVSSQIQSFQLTHTTSLCPALSLSLSLCPALSLSLSVQLSLSVSLSLSLSVVYAPC